MSEETAKTVSEQIKEKVEELRKSFVTTEELQKALSSNRKVMVAGEDEMKEAIEFYKSLVSPEKAKAGVSDYVDNALVPSSVAKQILEELKSYWVRRECTVFPDNKGTLFYEGTGITAHRTAVGSAAAESTPTVNEISYSGYDVVASVVVSTKLLEKANPDVVKYINNMFAKALFNLEEKEVIKGNPASHEFEGLYNASGIPTVTAASGHTSIDSLDYDDFVKLFTAVPKEYRDRSIWVISSAIEQRVMKIKDSNGQPIFDLNSGKIFNRPYVLTSHLDTSGTTNPVAYFGYMKEFYIFDDKGYQIVVTKEGKELVTKRQTLLVLVASTDGKLVSKSHLAGLKLASS